MLTLPHKNDSYSDFMHNTLGSPGQSGLDLYAQSPSRRSINRVYETTRMTGRETQEFRIPERWLICGGCCVGIGSDNLARPALPEYGLQRILGFCIRTIENNRAVVRVGGSILLKVEGLGMNDTENTVFVIGPNTFTFDRHAGGLPLGTVKHLEAAGVLVAFGESAENGKDFYRAPSRKHY